MRRKPPLNKNANYIFNDGKHEEAMAAAIDDIAKENKSENKNRLFYYGVGGKGALRVDSYIIGQSHVKMSPKRFIKEYINI